MPKPSLNEDHCCDDATLPIEKYLQMGRGLGHQILVVAESPAANGWYKSGRAFYTVEGKVVESGKNLLECLKLIDKTLTLETISFTEIAKCFVAGNRKNLDLCAKKTWPHFLKQIDYIKPKVIIILGQKTTDIFNQLAGTDLSVGKITRLEIANLKPMVLPLYHPSPANPKRRYNKEIITTNLAEIKSCF